MRWKLASVVGVDLFTILQNIFFYFITSVYSRTLLLALSGQCNKSMSMYLSHTVSSVGHSSSLNSEKHSKEMRMKPLVCFNMHLLSKE